VKKEGRNQSVPEYPILGYSALDDRRLFVLFHPLNRPDPTSFSRAPRPGLLTISIPAWGLRSFGCPSFLPEPRLPDNFHPSMG